MNHLNTNHSFTLSLAELKMQAKIGGYY